MDYELFLQSNLDKKSVGEMLERFTTDINSKSNVCERFFCYSWKGKALLVQY